MGSPHSGFAAPQGRGKPEAGAWRRKSVRGSLLRGVVIRVVADVLVRAELLQLVEVVVNLAEIACAGDEFGDLLHCVIVDQRLEVGQTGRGTIRTEMAAENRSTAVEKLI